MRQSRTTRHKPLGIAALFSFAGAVPDEIYRQGDAKRGTNIPLGASLDESDRRWCLSGVQITLVVRSASRVPNRSLPLLRPVPFYPSSCAVVRCRRMKKGRMAQGGAMARIGLVLA